MLFANCESRLGLRQWRRLRWRWASAPILRFSASPMAFSSAIYPTGTRNVWRCYGALDATTIATSFQPPISTITAPKATFSRMLSRLETGTPSFQDRVIRVPSQGCRWGMVI